MTASKAYSLKSFGEKAPSVARRLGAGLRSAVKLYCEWERAEALATGTELKIRE
jgi:hypothetical protein